MKSVETPLTLAPVGPGELDRDGLALEELAGAVGVEFNPLTAREALRGATRTDAGPMARLCSAGSDVGIRFTVGRWATREALEQLQPGSALVARGADGEWLVVVGRDGRHLVLGDGRKLAERDLERSGGWGGEDEVEWAVAQAQAPLEGMVAPPPDDHGHGGHGDDHGPSPLRRLMALLQPEGRDLWVVVVFAAAVGVLSLAVPITVEALVSSVQGGNQAMFQVVVVLSLVLLGCLGLAGAMRAMNQYVVELIQRRVFVRVVGDLAYRLPRVKASALDRQHGPELVNRFFDVLTVQKAGSTLLLDGVAVVLQATIGLLVLAVWHPYLLGFNIALLVALLGIIFLLGRGAIQTKIRESYAKYAVAGWLEEMVRHPLAFKLSAGQDYALERADALARGYLVSRDASFRILFRQIMFGFALQALASAAMLGLGGFLVIQNSLTLGQLVAAELIVAVTVGSFVKLGKSLESVYDLMAAVDKLGHLIDLPLEREEGERAPGRSGPASVRLVDVSFEYEDDHGREVLRGLTETVEAGKRVALVGPSGAGKSTLVELLYGLREPTRGHIELDGVDLRDLRLDHLREQVVSVAGAEVFEGTVLDNVRMGRAGVSLSDVREALAKARLLDDVQGLPRGLHTPLATGGAPLSRGQSQRLVLARALAGRPRLLILDEMLDEFDEDLRRPLQVELFDRQAPWTLLVVSHNPEVLAACDRALLLPRSRPAGRAH